ncbi:MAG: sulfur carrier protein ThiS [Hydrogenovibrio crunogenus]|uniref:Thiamine biosynthesis sulfur transport protein ThiS n=1 Tax=Hydrogenovibrio crunogenus (strain DSM 25203 / XCL-2) TaxID=317025 RepID=Q31JD1_HYDCU|nr:sulfur carrier protein ThiS [Hydrogenovibrio crunogenus]
MTTITVQINDEIKAIPASLSLTDLLNQLGYQEHNFAVAINDAFVPRSQYETTPIQTDDRIEIVAPMQGG